MHWHLGWQNLLKCRQQIPGLGIKQHCSRVVPNVKWVTHEDYYCSHVTYFWCSAIEQRWIVLHQSESWHRHMGIQTGQLCRLTLWPRDRDTHVPSGSDPVSGSPRQERKLRLNLVKMSIKLVRKRSLLNRPIWYVICLSRFKKDCRSFNFSGSIHWKWILSFQLKALKQPSTKHQR